MVHLYKDDCLQPRKAGLPFAIRTLSAQRLPPAMCAWVWWSLAIKMYRHWATTYTLRHDVIYPRSTRTKLLPQPLHDGHLLPAISAKYTTPRPIHSKSAQISHTALFQQCV